MPNSGWPMCCRYGWVCIPVRRNCGTGVLSNALVDLVRWRTQLRHPSMEIWHGTRYIEEWAESATMNELAATRTGYGVQEIGLSRRRLAALFRQLEAECREISGFAAAVDKEAVWQLFERLLVRPPDLGSNGSQRSNDG